MILVTGAAGKTGRSLIQTLAAAGKPVRALVHRREYVEPLLALGAAEGVVGDQRREPVVRQALRGAAAVYHICPNMHPDEILIGRVAVESARAAGVGHFVYHSVLHPQTEAMAHHWQKLRVEELIFESGLPFTILQPAAYMQNILARWPAIVAKGVFANPYPAATRLSLVDLADVAAAAAHVLGDEAHFGATYELVGTAPLAQTEVAAVLTAALDRPVQAVETPLTDWWQSAQAAGLPDYALKTLAAMFRYYARFGLAGSPNVLRWLLGREPTTLAEFFARNAPAQNQYWVGRSRRP